MPASSNAVQNQNCEPDSKSARFDTDIQVSFQFKIGVFISQLCFSERARGVDYK